MSTVGKVRVYEIARQLGMSTDDVVEQLRVRGEPVTSASSSVHLAVADVFIAKVRAQGRPAAPPVVRRRVETPAPIAPSAMVPSPAIVEPAVPDPDPIELLDMRTRFERQLAEARAKSAGRRG